MTRLIIFALTLSLMSCEKEAGQASEATNTSSEKMNSAGISKWYFSIEENDSTLLSIYIKPTGSNSWDGWNFSSNTLNGNISTSLEEDWDSWILSNETFNIHIKTSYAEDWDNWDVDDYVNNWHCDVSTSFSENWNDWDANESSDGGHIDLITYHNENLDDWKITGQWNQDLPPEYKISVMFVPVIVNIMRNQEIISE